MFQLAPLAKARLWFDTATPAFASSGRLAKQVDVDPGSLYRL